MSIVHLNAPASFTNAIRFGPQGSLSTAVKSVPNGAATIMFIGRRGTAGASADAMNLWDGLSNANSWYHGIAWQTNNLYDDDGLVGSSDGAFNPGTTDLIMTAVTLPATGTACTFHAKNITTGAAAAHTAGGANGGKRSITATNVHICIGYAGSTSGMTGDLVAAAIWDVQLTNAQIDECWANSKTSDLWNNSAGNPDFLVEGNTLSMVDLSAGAAPLVGVGTATLTGADPAWTFDGIGGTPYVYVPDLHASVAGTFDPVLVPTGWF